MGCPHAGPPGGEPSGTPYLSFYCDDLEGTIAELLEHGVEFVDEISDVGYGLAVHFKVPGDFTVELYQPRYRRNSAAE